MTLDVHDNLYPQSLLSGAFAEPDLQSLLGRGRKRTYAKGEMIVSRGDEGSSIFLIEDGQVEVSVTSINGRKSVLNHMGPGEILGEIAVLDGGERSADAIAISSVSGVIVDRGTVRNFLKANPEACFALIEALCAKVRNASDMFETRAMITASARLARCLLRLGEKWGEAGPKGAIRITQPVSQSDLGEFAGIARENVNRTMQTWMHDGLVSIDNGCITLVDPVRLEAISED